ncbi:hypothetical protein NQ317_011808 [Molorchus minor]|uniref:MOSC domain-containing protein n=1 Tax=Molorchus minor TaxID=1323400 RepID=A0ABQ9JEX1_9CUCU|nr:hypothetical protein NQ317_011808 [Molorchus minor]
MVTPSGAVLNQHTVVVACLVTAAAVIVTGYIYHRLRRTRLPTEWKPVGKVAKLCIFPFKSGKRIEVEKAKCTKQGLMEMEKADGSIRLRDRSFVVYHAENHEYRNARHYPKMVVVEIRAHDKDSVVLKAPDVRTLHLRLPSKEEHPEVVIKHYRQEQITSIDCGDEAATWISEFILGKINGLRMAYHDGTYKRTQINKLYKDKIDYYRRGLRNESTGLNADLTAMHIINAASVREVNRRIGTAAVTVDNFRPNLVVDGPNLEPFEEDNWEWIKCGNVVIKNVVECMRCIMTTVDTETGIRRTDREPLKTMEKFRMSKGPEKAPVMGILLEAFETGIISVGDTVYIGKTSRRQY